MKMRRGWFRLIAAVTVSATILLYLHFYFPSFSKNEKGNILFEPPQGTSMIRKAKTRNIGIDLLIDGKGQATPNKQCLPIEMAKTDINTVDEFPKFEFQPEWMRGKEFWDASFEKRYLQRKMKWKKVPLKVFVMPHSHADPGWLKTYEEYYFLQASKILSNMVDKLQEHKNMTFIWSEISFLSMWYERAHPKLREQLRDLVHSGRLEIVTGGWVMTDEATAHLYAMVNQFIEGHQWIKDTLGIQPESGWSVDVFGHGNTVPYLLKESSISGTVIQRVHYAWKQWLAETQNDDFMWRQSWDSHGEHDLLTHNRPYDIYSIKHSCGPHPQICLNFDFRKIFGEYTEYSIKAVNIDDQNVQNKAELLLEQYGRTGSLFSHNVVLVPLGDDFRYDHGSEWDQQYTNYQKLMDYINSNPYHATVQWGTLKDYFKEINLRSKEFPSLQGDFFVYSDIFSEGRPAYWSGYYTTRPYWKLLARQLEGALHTAEALFSWAWVEVVRKNLKRPKQELVKDYELLVKARRHMALFQHHDAITGTSKSYVMHDYAVKLHEGIQIAFSIISHSSLILLATDATFVNLRSDKSNFDLLQPSFLKQSYEKESKMIPLLFERPQKIIVLTNSLGQRRTEIVKVVIKTIKFRLTDEFGHEVAYQINPVWNATDDGMVVVSSQFELVFVVDLPPMSIITYTLHATDVELPKEHMATIYSNFYGSTNEENSKKDLFEMRDVIPGDIQLESEPLKLLFDGTTGMLRSVTEKSTGRITQLFMKYGAYPSFQFKSGAYLFYPDPNSHSGQEDVLKGAKPHIFIQSGPVVSEIAVMFGNVLMHTIRLYHVNVEPLNSAIYMESSFNLASKYSQSETPGFSPLFRETELYLRFSTDINNGKDPVLYSDVGGFQMQKRVKVEKIGIQGNYFPITTAAYIEDSADVIKRRRLTLLVDHGCGISSWKEGWLETMVERKMSFDDARGMGEGVTDQKRTTARYWLLLEHLTGIEEVPRLSLAAHHLSNGLNVPPVILAESGLRSGSLKSAAHFTKRPFPCSFNLLTLRTLPLPQYPLNLPSSRALMVLQHQSASCNVHSIVNTCRGFNDSFSSDMGLNVPVYQIEEMDLTGIKKKRTLESLNDLVLPHHRIKTVRITFQGEP